MMNFFSIQVFGYFMLNYENRCVRLFLHRDPVGFFEKEKQVKQDILLQLHFFRNIVGPVGEMVKVKIFFAKKVASIWSSGMLNECILF